MTTAAGPLDAALGFSLAGGSIALLALALIIAAAIDAAAWIRNWRKP